jgi:hypothetical protein
MDHNNLSKTESNQSFASEVGKDRVNWWPCGPDQGYIVEIGGMSGAIYHDHDLPPTVESYVSFSSMDIHPPSDPEPTLVETDDGDRLTEPKKEASGNVKPPNWRKAFSFLRIFDTAQ